MTRANKKVRNFNQKWIFSLSYDLWRNEICKVNANRGSSVAAWTLLWKHRITSIFRLLQFGFNYCRTAFSCFSSPASVDTPPCIWTLWSLCVHSISSLLEASVFWDFFKSLLQWDECNSLLPFPFPSLNSTQRNTSRCVRDTTVKNRSWGNDCLRRLMFLSRTIQC